MKKRNRCLDLLKFLFAVLIVVFHAKEFSDDGNYIFPGGSIAVEFFFIVSGALMVASASRSEVTTTLGRDTRDFIWHKFKGLMPNYYVAFVIAFIVMNRNAHSISSVLNTLANSFWEILLLTGVGLRKPGGLINGPIWYLSSMLVVMLVIWPIMRKYKDTFFYIIAPISLLFLLGITFQNWIHLGGPSTWLGYISKGTVRAFMAILLGCMVYLASAKLKTIEFTNISKAIFSLIEVAGYASIFVISFYYGRDYYDWLLLIGLAICITITMSNVSFWAAWLQAPIFNWLGVFSYSLYLGHGFWANSMAEMFPNLTYFERMPIYLALAVITGLIIHYGSLGLKKLWAAKGESIKSVFIA